MELYSIYINTLYFLCKQEKKKLKILNKKIHWLSVGFPIPNDPELKEELKKTLSR